MPEKLKATTMASAAIAGLVLATGAGAAITANAESATPGNSSSSTPSHQASAPTKDGTQDQQGERDGRGGRGGDHAAATTQQTEQVTAAVEAKDSTVTVERVMVDADGSYDVAATKDGDRVMFEVSKDLKTVTERQGGPGGHGGRGERGGRFTDASTDETAKVTAAVKAKDSAVEVEKVGKLDDGSFVAMGTKDGERAGHRVSADYKTVTTQEFPGGRGGRGGKHTAATTQQTEQVTAAVEAKDSTVTVERVMVDADGSYDVAATKDGDRVMFEVSKDLKTVTQKEKPQR